MKKSKFSKALQIKDKIPKKEVVFKFISTDPGLGMSNDIVLSINQKHIVPKSLKTLIASEFKCFSKDQLPSEFCTLKEFIDLEMKSQFVDFLAITLIAYASLPESEKRNYKPGSYFNDEGILVIALDKKQLTVGDYCQAVNKFLSQHEFNLDASNVYIQFLLSAEDINQIIRDE